MPQVQQRPAEVGLQNPQQLLVEFAEAGNQKSSLVQELNRKLRESLRLRKWLGQPIQTQNLFELLPVLH